MAKKRLGIDALFQTAVPRAVPQTDPAAAHEIEVGRLVPGRRQPRSHFANAALGDLTESVRVHGVLQPLLVRPVGDGTYEIVAGERRWRAAKGAGLARVPVRVVEISDGDALAFAMVENLQREDLNPLEEAEGYIELLRARLVGETGFRPFVDEDDPRGGVVRLLRALNNRTAGNTKDNAVLSLEPAVREVFGRVGRITWQSFVAHRLPLLGMPDDVAAALRGGGLEYTKARLIARVTAERLGVDDGRARRIRRDLIEQSATEGLSVRGLQSEIARLVGAKRAEMAGANAGVRASRTGQGPRDLEQKLESLRSRLDAIDLDAIEADRRTAIMASVEALLGLL